MYIQPNMSLEARMMNAPAPEKPRKEPPPLPKRPAKAEVPRAMESLQTKDTVEAFEVGGFDGLEVAVTLDKKGENIQSEHPNEDYFVADAKTGLIGVLDGLGGEGQGDKASFSAAAAFPVAYERSLAESRLKQHDEVIAALVENQLKRKGLKEGDALYEENKMNLIAMCEQIYTEDATILRKASALIEAFTAANESVKRTGGKTTACMSTIHRTPDGTRWAIVANTGDSRAFKRRANGEIVPISKEDSMINFLIDSGRLSQETLTDMKMNPEDAVAFGHPYDQLKVAMFGALGSEQFAPSLEIRRLDIGDELILVTDGVVDVFENPDTDETDTHDFAMELRVAEDKSVKGIADRVRHAARERDDIKDDDIAAIVVKAV
jgi:serine/threonine protein phosphatase PrpC